MACSSRLWMLSALVVTTACVSGSVDGNSTSSATEPSTDTSTSGVPSTTSASDGTSSTTRASADDDDTTRGDASSSTTIDVTTSSEATSSEATSQDSGDAHNEACVAGCMVEFGCQDTCECGTTWQSEDACVQWCEANLVEAATFTEFCRDAWEAISACIGTLSCEDYQEFHNPQVRDYPCVDQADVLAFDCDGQ